MNILSFTGIALALVNGMGLLYSTAADESYSASNFEGGNCYEKIEGDTVFLRGYVDCVRLRVH